MPKAAHQDMFPQESCNICEVPGALYLTLRGKYMWKCEDCLQAWVTPNSAMNLMNIMNGNTLKAPIRKIIKEEFKG